MTVSTADRKIASFDGRFSSRAREPFWEGECFRWGGSHGATGYGMYSTMRIHRLFWVLFNGPIPEDLVVDHVYTRGCRFRDCIRITHMELVPQSENSRRTLFNQDQRSRTHCPHGHEYTKENIIWEGTSRHCRICVNAAISRWKKSQKDKKLVSA